MKHSQKHRGRTIVVHARPREHHDGYAWTYSVEDLPAIAGCGMTGDDTGVREIALRQAMCAARRAIDELDEASIAHEGKARDDAALRFHGPSTPAAGCGLSHPEQAAQRRLLAPARLVAGP